jgi:hypothetical protein
MHQGAWRWRRNGGIALHPAGLGDKGETTSVVVISGWLDERNPKPVSLSDLIRKHAGVGLVGAKRILDEFAEAGAVRVTFASRERADAFVDEGASLGLRCARDG